ncbi:MAG: alpha/beta hydrolase, partial [Candidatus Zixiibacteriota bacterium]
GLILESTLTSVPDLGSSVYPYFPVRLLARLSYNNLDYITRITTPLLVTHSPYDEIIPYEFGRRVFEAAPEPKEFHDIAGGHNNATSADLTLYRSTLAAFIDRRLPVDSTADSNQVNSTGARLITC